MSHLDYSAFIKQTGAGFTTAKDFAENVGYNKKTILYVGGLDEKVDEEVLQGVFQPFGELVTVLIPRDQGQKKHRGFGFVEFEDPDDAKHAMENMQDSELFGRVIKCNIAKPNALKAKAVWDDADKWYEQHLKEDANAVNTEIRHKDATDTKGEMKELPSTTTPGISAMDVKEDKSTDKKDQKDQKDQGGGNKKRKKNKKGKGKGKLVDQAGGKDDGTKKKEKPKATVSFEDVFGRYFIYT